MKKLHIILLSVLAVIILAGAAYFVFVHFMQAPKNVLVSTFVCPDKSHYVVIQEEDRLLISGATFMRIEESSRFSDGNSQVEISGETFTLQSGETSITCTAGIPEGGLPPIITQ